MQHSQITLTMDTYGHLFPGQEAETVGKLPPMFADCPIGKPTRECNREYLPHEPAQDSAK
jgi:hypothetical protein